MDEATTASVGSVYRAPGLVRARARSVLGRGVLLLIALLASACANNAPGIHSSEYGTIIGSVEVVLARPPRSVFDGFFEENLTRSNMSYSFRIGHEGRSWMQAPAAVATRGEPRAFAVSLPPGRNIVEDLELRKHAGPRSMVLGLLSPIHGREIDISLEFPVEPGRITYIGRVRVVLPTNIKLFSTRYKLTVEDQAVEDYASMASLIESVPLPVHKALATRIK